MFIRAKKVKNQYYAYAVNNRWTKKGSRQKVSKYLGKIIRLEQIYDKEFEDLFVVDMNEIDALDLLKKVLTLELYNHGLIEKKKDIWQSGDLVINLKTATVRENKKDIVIQFDNDYFCTYTLKRLLRFKSDKDENGVATELAKALIQAGIPIRQDLFVQLFKKVYRSGQSFIGKSSKVRVDRKVILVTGTPGTGKTTLSKQLAKYIKAEYIDVNKVIEEYSLQDGFDKKRDAKIIDTNRLTVQLTKIIKSSTDSLVIDSHLSHYLSPKKVDKCIVTRCNLKELKKRLEKRGYDEDKVRENLDSEIFEVCLLEAKELDHDIKEVWTDKEVDIGKISKALLS